LVRKHEIPIQLDAEILIEEAETTTAKKCWERAEDKARLQTAEHVFPRITASSKQQRDDNKREDFSQGAVRNVRENY
jgi:hypothetical protein